MTNERTKYYFWLSNRSGYEWACTLKFKNELDKRAAQTGERFKYIGFTYDVGFPKKMSTGRIFYKPTAKAFKKQKERRKKAFKTLS